MRISEPDLLLPTLLLISENPDITTGELREELELIFKPEGEDAVILANRSDSKFTQMVRNLVSHETLSREGYAVYSARVGGRGGTFEIMEKGQIFLDKHREELIDLLENGFPYDNLIGSVRELRNQSAKKRGRKLFIDENAVVTEGARVTSKSRRYQRSNDVRQAAIEYYRESDGRLRCIGCRFDFFEIYGDIGKDYIEIHHEEPLFLQEGKATEQSLKRAVSKVKPLCSNCHRMVHRKRRSMLSVAQLQETVDQHRASR